MTMTSGNITTTSANDDILLDVRDLTMFFPVTRGIIFERKVADVKAVDHISFTVKRGETLGLVGESGCGKTTTGRAILQLYRPTDGQVLFQDDDEGNFIDLTKIKCERMRRM